MYRKQSHIHFMGIGGIGMSGLATILRSQGYTISGCDQNMEQQSIVNLNTLGCIIADDHNSTVCTAPGIDILVYSSAIPDTNPEILAAHKRGIPVIPRALMLAELMRTKFSIAVAGSHGKTTTTSMIAHILMEAGVDPTVIVGGHLKNISTNAHLGHSNFLVAEADESDRSFLHLFPTFGIVTNIDLEHLETYTDLEDIKDTFKQFLSNLPFYGKALLCIDDEVIRDILPIPHIKIETYGLTPDATIYGTINTLAGTHTDISVYKHGTHLGELRIPMPGRHNVLNAIAATSIALDLEVPFEKIRSAFSTFKGIERRFSFCGTYRGADIFDDYGHHPKEIANTLIIAENRTEGGIHVFFQPHRYTRTQHLWDDFITAFGSTPLASLTITDIYAASEAPIEGITSQSFVSALQTAYPGLEVNYVPYEKDLNALTAAAHNRVEKDDMILLLGAGPINLLQKKLQD